MNAKSLLVIQSILLVILILVISVGIVLDRTSPPNRANSSVSLPTLVPTAQATPTAVSSSALLTKWEYLTVAYSQNTNFSDEPNAPPRYEMVLADAEPYASQFMAIIGAGCGDIKDSYTDSIGCMAKNFKGESYYLNLLGQDGWELIQLDNQSSQYTYKVDLLFKRFVS